MHHILSCPGLGGLRKKSLKIASVIPIASFWVTAKRVCQICFQRVHMIVACPQADVSSDLTFLKIRPGFSSLRRHTTSNDMCLQVADSPPENFTSMRDVARFPLKPL